MVKKKAVRLVRDAATLSVGAFMVGSIPTVPGHALNVMPGFNIASTGVLVSGAGMALDELKTLDRKVKRRK